jgi:hypothetical protein
MKINKINDIPPYQAVKQIADSTSQNKSKGELDHFFGQRGFKIKNENYNQSQKGDESQNNPGSRLLEMGESAENNAPIMYSRQAKKTRDDFHSLK